MSMPLRRRRFAQRRKTLGYSQERFAERLGVERSTVVRWERGETEPRPWLRPTIARTLQVSLEMLEELLTEGDGGEPAVHALRHGPAAAAMGLEAAAHTSALQAFRVMDRQVGGAHLYATVVRYLHAEVEPHRFSDAEDLNDTIILTAAAGLNDMAGWMAHDAGDDAQAQQHFARAWAYVRMGADPQLGAQVDASMSHLEIHFQRPEQALRLARHGRQMLRKGPSNSGLEARLLAMEARGLAELSEADECLRLLARAESALARSAGEQPTRWLNQFDEGALAGETARCMCRPGDLVEARRQAERVVALRPSSRTRSRALGQLTLASVLVAEGQTDGACSLAQEVIEATQSLGSLRVVQQLLDLKPILAPHRANTIVAGFLDSLDEALGQRRWLFHWLTAPRRGLSDAHWERP